MCVALLISGLVGPVAQTRCAGWPGCILYTDCTQVQYSKTVYIYVTRLKCTQPRDAWSTASASRTGAESDPVDPRACISRDPTRRPLAATYLFN